MPVLQKTSRKLLDFTGSFDITLMKLFHTLNGLPLTNQGSGTPMASPYKEESSRVGRPHFYDFLQPVFAISYPGMSYVAV